MQTTYSIVEARNQFTALIHTVENNADPITVVRHGKPVAIILSVEMYERLQGGSLSHTLDMAYQQFRTKWDEVLIDDEGEIWANVRESTPMKEENPWL